MAVTPVLAFQWVGDLTPGSKYGVPGTGGRAQLAPARPLLSDADLTEANLEGTYSRGGTSKCGRRVGRDCFAFQAPPGNAPALRWAGIDAVNVANNHAFDFGVAGQAQTLGALRRAQVQWTGRPGQVRIVEVNGVKVAFQESVFQGGHQLLEIKYTDVQVNAPVDEKLFQKPQPTPQG